MCFKNMSEAEKDNDEVGTPKDSSDDAIKDATETGVDALSNSNGSDWKNSLSGALDEERLLCALAVLCIFYIGQVLANAYHENNNKDEDTIMETCGCRPEHRAFYITWSIICYLLWFVCHSLLLLHNNPSSLDKLKKLFKFFFCMRRNNHNSVQWKWEWKCCCCITICKSLDKYEVISGSSNSWITKIKNQYEPIDHYKYHLWTQYYELYVVGITKKSDAYQVDEIIFNKTKPDDKKQSTNKNPTKKRIKNNDKADLLNNIEIPPDTESNSSFKAPIKGATTVTALPHETNQLLLYCIQTVLYYILGIIRYMAQLSIVPLLMIQIYDTYAYLCFTANNYCSTTSQYKLHLDQTAMTFAFYCSLMVSLLSTTMLRWFPCPTKSKSLGIKEDKSKNKFSPSAV